MKTKSRWMAVLLSFVLMISFCIGDMQTVQAKKHIVGNAPKKLSLNYTSVTMQKGAKLTLRVTAVSPSGASKKVTWKSSNKKVVSVSKKGVLTAKKKGTATITAKAKSGGKKIKCKVKVTNRKKAASKVLVAYFSATGTTKGIAKKVAKASGGTLYRITPAKKYSSKDLNYNNDNSRANKEQNNKKARPSIKGKTVNIKDFDTVFIAYPIWHGQAPRIISTFLESYDFSGKTVIPFCTSHSSGIGSSANALKKSCKKNVTWKSGRRFAGDESQSEINKWVKSLGVNNGNAGQDNTPKPETPKTPKPTDGTTDTPKPTDTTTDKKPDAGPTDPVTNPTTNPTESPKPSDKPVGNKILVAYFSCTGTTKKLAEYAAEVSGGNLYEIVPEVPYTSEDLNYGNAQSRTTKEQNDSTARPRIQGAVGNMGDYKAILLAYPIWHGQAPRIISTFLESYDFSGKTIIPFCTSHSSGIGSSDTNLHSLCSETAEWKAGRRFSSNTAQDEIREWLDGFSLDELVGTDTKEISNFPLSEGVNGKAPTIPLNSGYEMPVLGIGTYSLLGDVCINSVSAALKSGVRKIDTAYMYHNEAEVGEAVRNSGIPREEIFVTTKLYPNQFDEPEKAIDEALEKLNIGYIDLMLLHHPGTNDVKAYKAMEKAVAEGKIHSIGLSNWYVEEMEEFFPQITIPPALVQNEIHPYYQEKGIVEYMHEKGIVMEAWYPFGGRGHTGELFADETISAIAAAHGKTSAQVSLRWHLQRGVVAIPGSSNPDHIKENISVFDFELTEEEMERIGTLDRNEKHDWY